MVEKYYSGLANAGDWSGIGITEGFAMYLDQIGESKIAQSLLDSFNAQFEGEEKRVSRTEKLYELSQRLEAANESEVNEDVYGDLEMAISDMDFDAYQNLAMEFGIDTDDPNMMMDFIYNELDKKGAKLLIKNINKGVYESTVNEAKSDKVEIDIDFAGSKADLRKLSKKYNIEADEYNPGMVMLKGDKKDILAYLTSPQYDMDMRDIEDLFPELLESTVNEAKEKPFDRLNKIADEQYGEFGFSSLGEDDMANHIDMKKADKLADKQYGEFGFATLSEDEMEELINSNPKLVKESAVTEAEIKSDDEFKEYAFTVLQKAFGEDFDEAKAQEVVDGILGKVDGDYGKAAGILQASLA